MNNPKKIIHYKVMKSYKLEAGDFCPKCGLHLLDLTYQLGVPENINLIGSLVCPNCKIMYTAWN